MSVSKYKYEADKCDGQPCVGDCDLCYIALEELEKEEHKDEVLSEVRQ